MSLGAVARRAAKQVIHEASIKVPPIVQVSKTADLLTFKGPLGTSHLGLSRIDTLGDAALKLSPESREIAICSPSKGFFGTLQVPGQADTQIRMSSNVAGPLTWGHCTLHVWAHSMHVHFCDWGSTTCLTLMDYAT